MKTLLAAALTLAITVPAHAGFMDALNAVSQVASAVQQTRQGGQATINDTAAASTTNTNTLNTQPMDSSELEYMSCAQLELAGLRSKRELEDAKANLKSLDEMSKNPDYQQQKKMGSALGMLGSLVANNGGKSAQYGQLAQQMGGNAANVDQQIEQQLALGKKYMADLESIAVYQKHSDCNAPAQSVSKKR
jgi:hypothetical protein